MSELRERLADAIGSADRLAATDREVHLEQADAVIEVIQMDWRRKRDPRWSWLRHLNAIRSLLFGDGIHTTSGLVKGEDSRLQVATHLNQLQADLGIPSSVEPSR